MNQKGNKEIVRIVSYIGSFLILGILVFLAYSKDANSYTENNSKELGTCKTPEEAFLETQKALQLLSFQINSGIESATYIKEYDNATNKIFKPKEK